MLAVVEHAAAGQQAVDVAEEHRNVSIPIVARGASGTSAPYPRTSCLRMLSSQLTARAKPAGLHCERNRITHSWLAAYRAERNIAS